MRRFTAYLSLLWLVLTSCTPAKAPTAVDVTTAAIVLTDQALADLIEATPLDAGVGLDSQYEDAVEALERAKGVLERREDACLVLPSVVTVARLVKCNQCETLAVKASEQLSCQR